MSSKKQRKVWLCGARSEQISFVCASTRHAHSGRIKALTMSKLKCHSMHTHHSHQWVGTVNTEGSSYKSTVWMKTLYMSSFNSFNLYWLDKYSLLWKQCYLLCKAIKHLLFQIQLFVEIKQSQYLFPWWYYVHVVL